MGLISDERTAIKSILSAVAGMGTVYSDRHNPNDEKSYKEKFVSGGHVNFAEIYLGGATESTDDQMGETSEDDVIQRTKRDNVWFIDLFYGFKYDATTPSEITFQNLVEAAENAFRFSQDLGGKCYKSYPLQRISAGLWQTTGNIVLCHKASWTITVRQLITNPN